MGIIGSKDVFVGAKFNTRNFGSVTVLEYKNAKNVLVQFEDGVTKWSTASHVRIGELKNNYTKTVYGVGYIGEGPFKTVGKVGGHTRAYNVWGNMLRRCYWEAQQNLQPTYVGVEVCKEWHNFQNFAMWYNSQPNCENPNFQLDKDLSGSKIKMYCPESCSLIPQEINLIVGSNKASRGDCVIGVCKQDGKFLSQCSTGNGHSIKLGIFDTEIEAFTTYKKAKEIAVQKLANEYKDVLPTKVYNFLLDYRVNFND